MGDGKGEGSPALSPLTGAYLLVILPQTHAKEHLEPVLHKLTKGLLSWDSDCCHVDLYKELQTIASHSPEGELVKHGKRLGERLIQFASENLVTEVLIHPQLNTLVQCLRNLLSSFTRHRHIIHAGYTYSGNGSWILQDGTFSFADFHHMFQEIEVQRVLVAYENTVTMDIHCCQEGDWANVKVTKEPFAKLSRLSINPDDKLSVNDDIKTFAEYLRPYIVSYSLEQLLEPSDVVGNIRFSHPTLYVFPGGQGDAALFGINGFNMLVDGGFSRKTCFWDFTRHLDRLDAALVTRLNNGNIQGISSFLQRKRMNHVYPQIGHFFCNVQDRKHPLSPDGDKDRDPMLINIIDQGQDLVSSLHHLNLKPQPCYRDTSMSPINLYHKVGHGKLDMYVLSPAKDSREVKDFIARWNANDMKLFATINKKSGEFSFPLPNRVSICALLVWQPANPNDNITRLLFPGSTPQHKIMDGLEKIKHLEFLKYPVCSAKSISPSSSTIGLNVRQNVKLKLHTDKPTQPVSDIKPAKLPEPMKPLKSEAPDTKVKPHSRAKKIAEKPKEDKIKDEKIKDKAKIEKEVKEEKEKEEKLSLDTAKEEEIIEKKAEEETIKEKDIVPEKVTESQTEQPTVEIDTLPRQIEIEIAEEVTQETMENVIAEQKESEKVLEKNLENLLDTSKEMKTDLESKAEIISVDKIDKPKKEAKGEKLKVEAVKKGDRVSKKRELPEKTEKEDRPKRTVARKSDRKMPKPSAKAEDRKAESAKSSPTTPKKTPVPKLMGEPKARPLKSKPSPSATPAKSTKEENNRKVVEQRAQKIAKKEEIKKIDRKPLARKATTESSRDVRKSTSPIKAVTKAKPRKAPVDKEPKVTAATVPSTQSVPKGKAIKGKKVVENGIKIISEIVKGSDILNEDVSLSKEEDEILIVEKIELELYPEEVPSEEKEAAVATEREEAGKIEGLVAELKEEEAEEIKEEVKGIIETATDIVMKAKSPEEAEKAVKEKIPLKDADKDLKEKSNEMEQKQQAEESHPDEKFSATVESGATTTAPTLPEDERIPIEEVKEGIEEKHVKEETKEKDQQQRPEQLESKIQEPVIATFDQKAQILRDIVKTPDEVADLPVHEVADYETAEPAARDLIPDESRPEEISGDELKFIKDGLEKEDKSKDLKEDQKISPEPIDEKVTDAVAEASKDAKPEEMLEAQEKVPDKVKVIAQLVDALEKEDEVAEKELAETEDNEKDKIEEIEKADEEEVKESEIKTTKAELTEKMEVEEVLEARVTEEEIKTALTVDQSEIIEPKQEKEVTTGIILKEDIKESIVEELDKKEQPDLSQKEESLQAESKIEPEIIPSEISLEIGKTKSPDKELASTEDAMLAKLKIKPSDKDEDDKNITDIETVEKEQYEIAQQDEITVTKKEIPKDLVQEDSPKDLSKSPEILTQDEIKSIQFEVSEKDVEKEKTSDSKIQKTEKDKDVSEEILTQEEVTIAQKVDVEDKVLSEEKIVQAEESVEKKVVQDETKVTEKKSDKDEVSDTSLKPSVEGELSPKSTAEEDLTEEEKSINKTDIESETPDSQIPVPTEEILEVPEIEAAEALEKKIIDKQLTLQKDKPSDGETDTEKVKEQIPPLVEKTEEILTEEEEGAKPESTDAPLTHEEDVPDITSAKLSLSGEGIIIETSTETRVKTATPSPEVRPEIDEAKKIVDDLVESPKEKSDKDVKDDNEVLLYERQDTVDIKEKEVIQKEEIDVSPLADEEIEKLKEDQDSEKVKPTEEEIKIGDESKLDETVKTDHESTAPSPDVSTEKDTTSTVTVKEADEAKPDGLSPAEDKPTLDTTEDKIIEKLSETEVTPVSKEVALDLTAEKLDEIVMPPTTIEDKTLDKKIKESPTKDSVKMEEKLDEPTKTEIDKEVKEIIEPKLEEPQVTTAQIKEDSKDESEIEKEKVSLSPPSEKSKEGAKEEEISKPAPVTTPEKTKEPSKKELETEEKIEQPKDELAEKEEKEQIKELTVEVSTIKDKKVEQPLEDKQVTQDKKEDIVEKEVDSEKKSKETMAEELKEPKTPEKIKEPITEAEVLKTEKQEDPTMAESKIETEKAEKTAQPMKIEEMKIKEQEDLTAAQPEVKADTAETKTIETEFDAKDIEKSKREEITQPTEKEVTSTEPKTDTTVEQIPLMQEEIDKVTLVEETKEPTVTQAEIKTHIEDEDKKKEPEAEKPTTKEEKIEATRTQAEVQGEPEDDSKDIVPTSTKEEKEKSVEAQPEPEKDGEIQDTKLKASDIETEEIIPPTKKEVELTTQKEDTIEKLIPVKDETIDIPSAVESKTTEEVVVEIKEKEPEVEAKTIDSLTRGEEKVEPTEAQTDKDIGITEEPTTMKIEVPKDEMADTIKQEVESSEKIEETSVKQPLPIKEEIKKKDAVLEEKIVPTVTKTEVEAEAVNKDTTKEPETEAKTEELPTTKDDKIEPTLIKAEAPDDKSKEPEAEAKTEEVSTSKEDKKETTVTQPEVKEEAVEDDKIKEPKAEAKAVELPTTKVDKEEPTVTQAEVKAKAVEDDKIKEPEAEAKAVELPTTKEDKAEPTVAQAEAVEDDKIKEPEAETKAVELPTTKKDKEESTVTQAEVKAVTADDKTKEPEAEADVKAVELPTTKEDKKEPTVSQAEVKAEAADDKPKESEAEAKAVELPMAKEDKKESTETQAAVKVYSVEDDKRKESEAEAKTVDLPTTKEDKKEPILIQAEVKAEVVEDGKIKESEAEAKAVDLPTTQDDKKEPTITQAEVKVDAVEDDKIIVSEAEAKTVDLPTTKEDREEPAVIQAEVADDKTKEPEAEADVKAVELPTTKEDKEEPTVTQAEVADDKTKEPEAEADVKAVELPTTKEDKEEPTVTQAEVADDKTKDPEAEADVKAVELPTTKEDMKEPTVTPAEVIAEAPDDKTKEPETESKDVELPTTKDDKIEPTITQEDVTAEDADDKTKVSEAEAKTEEQSTTKDDKIEPTGRKEEVKADAPDDKTKEPEAEAKDVELSTTKDDKIKPTVAQAKVKTEAVEDDKSKEIEIEAMAVELTSTEEEKVEPPVRLTEVKAVAIEGDKSEEAEDKAKTVELPTTKEEKLEPTVTPTEVKAEGADDKTKEPETEAEAVELPITKDDKIKPTVTIVEAAEDDKTKEPAVEAKTVELSTTKGEIVEPSVTQAEEKFETVEDDKSKDTETETVVVELATKEDKVEVVVTQAGVKLVVVEDKSKEAEDKGKTVELPTTKEEKLKPTVTPTEVKVEAVVDDKSKDPEAEAKAVELPSTKEEKIEPTVTEAEEKVEKLQIEEKSEGVESKELETEVKAAEVITPKEEIIEPKTTQAEINVVEQEIDVTAPEKVTKSVNEVGVLVIEEESKTEVVDDYHIKETNDKATAVKEPTTKVEKDEPTGTQAEIKAEITDTKTKQPEAEGMTIETSLLKEEKVETIGTKSEKIIDKIEETSTKAVNIDSMEIEEHVDMLPDKKAKEEDESSKVQEEVTKVEPKLKAEKIVDVAAEETEINVEAKKTEPEAKVQEVEVPVMEKAEEKIFKLEELEQVPSKAETEIKDVSDVKGETEEALPSTKVDSKAEKIDKSEVKIEMSDKSKKPEDPIVKEKSDVATDQKEDVQIITDKLEESEIRAEKIEDLAKEPDAKAESVEDSKVKEQGGEQLNDQTKKTDKKEEKIEKIVGKELYVEAKKDEPHSKEPEAKPELSEKPAIDSDVKTEISKDVTDDLSPIKELSKQDEQAKSEKNESEMEKLEQESVGEVKKEEEMTESVEIKSQKVEVSTVAQQEIKTEKIDEVLVEKKEDVTLKADEKVEHFKDKSEKEEAIPPVKPTEETDKETKPGKIEEFSSISSEETVDAVRSSLTDSKEKPVKLELTVEDEKVKETEPLISDKIIESEMKDEDKDEKPCLSPAEKKTVELKSDKSPDNKDGLKGKVEEVSLLSTTETEEKSKVTEEPSHGTKELEKETSLSVQLKGIETKQKDQIKTEVSEEVTVIQTKKLESVIPEEIISKTVSKEVSSPIPHSKLSEEEILKEIEQEIIPFKQEKKGGQSEEEILEKKQVQHEHHQSTLPVDEKFEAVRLPYEKSEKDISTELVEPEKQSSLPLKQLEEQKILEESKSDSHDKSIDSGKSVIDSVIGGIVSTCEKIASEILDKDTVAKVEQPSSKSESPIKQIEGDKKGQESSKIETKKEVRETDIKQIESEIISDTEILESVPTQKAISPLKEDKIVDITTQEEKIIKKEVSKSDSPSIDLKEKSDTAAKSEIHEIAITQVSKDDYSKADLHVDDDKKISDQDSLSKKEIKDESTKQAPSLTSEDISSAEIDYSELPPQQFKGEEIIDEAEIKDSAEPCKVTMDIKLPKPSLEDTKIDSETCKTESVIAHKSDDKVDTPKKDASPQKSPSKSPDPTQEIRESKSPETTETITPIGSKSTSEKTSPVPLENDITKELEITETKEEVLKTMDDSKGDEKVLEDKKQSLDKETKSEGTTSMTPVEISPSKEKIESEKKTEQTTESTVEKKIQLKTDEKEDTEPGKQSLPLSDGKLDSCQSAGTEDKPLEKTIVLEKPLELPKDVSTSIDSKIQDSKELPKESKIIKSESQIEILSKIVSTDDTKEIESTSISQLIENSELQSALFKDIKSTSTSVHEQSSVKDSSEGSKIITQSDLIQDVKESIKIISETLEESKKEIETSIIETVSEKVSEETKEKVSTEEKSSEPLTKSTIEKSIVISSDKSIKEKSSDSIKESVTSVSTSEKDSVKKSSTKIEDEMLETKEETKSSETTKLTAIVDSSKLSDVKVGSIIDCAVSESTESFAKTITETKVEKRSEEEMGSSQKEMAAEKETSEKPKEKTKKIEETVISDVTPVTKESEQFVVQLDFGMDAPETPRVEDAPEFKKIDSTATEEVKHTISNSRLPSELDTSSSLTDYHKPTEKEDRLKRIEPCAHETVINQTTLKEVESISLISDKKVSHTKEDMTKLPLILSDTKVQDIKDENEKEVIVQKHETESLEKTIKETSKPKTSPQKEFSSEKDQVQETSVKTVTSIFLEMESSKSAEQSKLDSESSSVRIISEKREGKGDTGVSSVIYELRKEVPTRSATPGSDIISEVESATPRSDLSSGQASRSTTHWEASEGRQDLEHFESDEEIPGSPMSIASHIPSPPNFDYDLKGKDSAMTSSFYGALPDEPDKKDTFAAMYISKYDDDSEIDPKTFSPSKVGPFEAKVSSERRDSMNLNGTKDSDKTVPEPRAESSKDPIESWGKPLGLPPPPKTMRNFDWNPIVEWGHPLGLPSPAPPTKDSNSDADLDLSNQSPTRRKIEKMNAENERIASNIYSGKETINKILKRSESPVKKAVKGETKKGTQVSPIYLDLTYVPHHGNSHYADVEFFKKVRARYYVFSGTEPSKEVFNALLEAKQTWEDKDLEVTIIPTYDTDTLAYWVAENEETLTKNKIDLSPSASRCTINLQDHETSCSAYRLEF